MVTICTTAATLAHIQDDSLHVGEPLNTKYVFNLTHNTRALFPTLTPVLTLIHNININD